MLTWKLFQDMILGIGEGDWESEIGRQESQHSGLLGAGHHCGATGAPSTWDNAEERCGVPLRIVQQASGKRLPSPAPVTVVRGCSRGVTLLTLPAYSA